MQTPKEQRQAENNNKNFHKSQRDLEKIFKAFSFNVTLFLEKS